MTVKKEPPADVTIILNTNSEITTAEATTILQVSPRAVLQMIQGGKLKATRKLPGRTGTYLLDRAQVEALASKRQSGDRP